MAEQAGQNQRKITAVLASIGLAILAKLKWVIGLLKFTKFGTTFLSLIISMGSYALFYGWKFAVILVYLIFVHEMGHLVAAKRKGIKTSPAVFVPFVGAVIGMKERPKNAATEAYLAYGGPLAGFISFLPAIPLYFLTHNPVWGLMIFLGAVLNLFNLLPVSPLDGGRIVTVLSTKIWLVGLVLLAVLVFFNHSPLMILILVIGFISWWGRARENYKAEVLSYRKERHRRYIRTLREYLDELYFMRMDEDGNPEPVLISEMRLFRLREVRNRANHLRGRIAEDSSFAIPFLQDEKKLKKAQLQIDLEYERRTLYFLDGVSTEYGALKQLISDAEQQVLGMDKELERLKTYYKAPASTKIKVLVLYIALAAVLSFFYFYGQQIANVALF